MVLKTDYKTADNLVLREQNAGNNLFLIIRNDGCVKLACHTSYGVDLA